MESVGIISIGIGFYYIITVLLEKNYFFTILYLIFFFGLVGITIFELILNKRFFHPKP
jgi:hypothetical protein